MEIFRYIGRIDGTRINSYFRILTKRKQYYRIRRQRNPYFRISTLPHRYRCYFFAEACREHQASRTGGRNDKSKSFSADLRSSRARLAASPPPDISCIITFVCLIFRIHRRTRCSCYFFLYSLNASSSNVIAGSRASTRRLDETAPA